MNKGDTPEAIMAAAEFMDDRLTPKQEKVAEKLTTLYATLGLFLSSTDAYDGLVLIQQAQQRATEVIKAARHHKAAWSLLERLVNTSDLGGLIVGHCLMFYAILAHHGRVPANPQMLAALGYSEAQILQPPPSTEDSEGFPDGYAGARA